MSKLAGGNRSARRRYDATMHQNANGKKQEEEELTPNPQEEADEDLVDGLAGICRRRGGGRSWGRRARRRRRQSRPNSLHADEEEEEAELVTRLVRLDVVGDDGAVRRRPRAERSGGGTRYGGEETLLEIGRAHV